MGQHRAVIADMDTRLPVAGAVVAASNGLRATSDYAGHWSMATAASSATISCKGYMQRRVNADELRQDTIFLIPQEVMLGGVTITAPGASFDTQKAMRGTRENISLPDPSKGFNLLGILHMIAPSGKAKGRERARKIKGILDKY